MAPCPMHGATQWIADSSHQMGREQDLRAVINEVLEGRDGGADAGVVGDGHGRLVERHVEVSAHQHALALELGLGKIADRLLGSLDDDGAGTGDASGGACGGDGGLKGGDGHAGGHCRHGADAAGGLHAAPSHHAGRLHACGQGHVGDRGRGGDVGEEGVKKGRV
eukprot:351841-Chlamydomonas_euryale.AAC.13